MVKTDQCNNYSAAVLVADLFLGQIQGASQFGSSLSEPEKVCGGASG